MKIAFISDIHEDIVNLRLAFQKIEKLGCNEIICLGDISGFNARHHHFHDLRSATECLRMVRQNCSVIIAGNHDLHAARKTPEHSPGFTYPEGWYSMDYPSRLSVSRDKVWLYDHDELSALYSHQEMNYLLELPEVRIKNFEHFNVLLSHYIYPNVTGNLSGFYTEAIEYKEHLQWMNSENCLYSFAGHLHYMGAFVIHNKTMVKKGFNRLIKLSPNSVIMVPPVVKNKFTNGFCVFDVHNHTIIAKRI